MRRIRSAPFSVPRLALSVALAAGVAFATSDVDAQSRGGKPSAAFPGAKPSSGWHGGGQGSWRGNDNWRGGQDGWRGGNRGDWRGGNHGDWRGGWRGGYRWQGWHGGRYYYPGWALGLGVGIGLTYPWWGWGYPYPYYPYYPYYPSSYVVYEPVYDAPVGVVIDRAGPATAPPAPAYRWYCPSPPAYYPEVRECSAGWLKVLPQEGGPTPPAALPPSTKPQSSAPAEDDGPPASRIAPGTMGNASSPTRIAAPRMTPPAQITRADASQEALAQNATQ